MILNKNKNFVCFCLANTLVTDDPNTPQIVQTQVESEKRIMGDPDDPLSYTIKEDEVKVEIQNNSTTPVTQENG